ncbi:2-hydroxychromene-2-carboxylate isomerase [uncultured Thalassolituus sp.]|uniref:2-hydroxychromene-2-carboxylate isomerase n=1 Tax=uncultured Thalassolituus sp. TaxID=285273 RepID=UPI0032B18045|tara:strand:+ start:1739 stop:2338 length:600 start_codon:yes stop_codon:yes gene_type:complete
MCKQIALYFDFSSAYSWLALSRLNELELVEQVSLQWRPISLGKVFAHHQHQVPRVESAKMRYLLADLSREARRLGTAFTLPKVFPFNAHLAMAVYYVLASTSVSRAQVFARSVFEQAYSAGRDVSQQPVLDQILQETVGSSDAFHGSEQLATGKAQLANMTDEAIQLGVFGAPTFVFDKTLFWGCDRVDALISELNKEQ